MIRETESKIFHDECQILLLIFLSAVIIGIAFILNVFNLHSFTFSLFTNFLEISLPFVFGTENLCFFKVFVLTIFCHIHCLHVLVIGFFESFFCFTIEILRAFHCFLDLFVCEVKIPHIADLIISLILSNIQFGHNQILPGLMIMHNSLSNEDKEKTGRHQNHSKFNNGQENEQN